MCVFSVIIPVYNAQLWLAECLDSVLAQDFTDYEMIIIDDCSPDESYKIYEAYAKKHDCIRIIKHDINRKQGAARNLGVRKAKGDWIVFLDSDDLMAQGALRFYYSKVNNTSHDIIGANFHRIDIDKNIIQSRMSQKLSEDKTFIMATDKSKILTSGICAKSLRRKAILQNKIFFDEDVFYEDVGYNAKLLELCPDYKIYNTIISYYRMNPHSTTHTQSEKHLIDRLQQTKKLHEGLLNNKIYSHLSSWYIAHTAVTIIAKSEFRTLQTLSVFKQMLCKQYNKNAFRDRYIILLVLYLSPIWLINGIFAIILEPMIKSLRIMKKWIYR